MSEAFDIYALLQKNYINFHFININILRILINLLKLRISNNKINN